jgi:ABC-type amino acid transport substrate-binding protein
LKKYTAKRTTEISAMDILRDNKKPLLALAAVAAVIVAVILLIINMAGRRSFDQSFLVSGDTIKIGIRTDVYPFGQVDGDGNITGFDREYIDEALGRLLPDRERRFEYVPITSQDAGASIKYSVANICLGLLVDGTDRTGGFRLTNPYYTDTVVAVVPGTSRLDKLSNLDGGKIGVFSGAILLDDVEKYGKKNQMDCDLLRYFDYESAMVDIENNRVNAIVLPYALARQFEEAGFRVLAEPLYEVGYSIMLPTGQAAVTGELNKVIAGMEYDGTAAELKYKWGL